MKSCSVRQPFRCISLYPFLKVLDFVLFDGQCCLPLGLWNFSTLTEVEFLPTAVFHHSKMHTNIFAFSTNTCIYKVCFAYENFPVSNIQTNNKISQTPCFDVAGGAMTEKGISGIHTFSHHNLFNLFRNRQGVTVRLIFPF